MLRQIVGIIILLCIIQTKGQTIRGFVYEIAFDGTISPISGANVYTLDHKKGTITNKHGYFEIDTNQLSTKTLIISILGYSSDTFHIQNADQELKIYLNLGYNLPVVEIIDDIPSTYILSLKAVPVQVISSGELRRAACCNLARSFETNASVDVQYNDGISGSKRILFLGLSGIYSQIMLENIPYIRGLSHIYGLEYIPGPWIDAISISKGTTSVVNGFEGITGQINVDLKKPEGVDKFHIHAALDNHFQHRLSTYNKTIIAQNLQTMTYAHYSNNRLIMDINLDGFQDEPLHNRLQLFNYWNYQTSKTGFEARWGLGGLYEKRKGGQLSYLRGQEDWFFRVNTSTYRLDLFTKAGYVFNNVNRSSIGFINSLFVQQMNSYFGAKQYDAVQKNYYANFIFNRNFINEHHNIQTGLSFQYDNLEELLSDSLLLINEIIPGTFVQYTLELDNFLTIMTGVRLDKHNLFGFFWTPRVHIKIELMENLSLRSSLGKGYRTPFSIAENIQILSTSRLLFINQLKQESAWNYGLNINWKKNFSSKRFMNVFAEYYRTDFSNQFIVDYNNNIATINLHQLDLPTNAQHFHIEIDYQHSKILEIRTAYRYNIAKIYYNNELKERYLVPRWKQLTTISLKTTNQKWQFDITSQYNGPTRLPEHNFLPSQYQLYTKTPAFVLLQANVNYFLKHFEFYAGVENIFNYTIDRAIIVYQSDDDLYFDSSLIWGPLVGRKFYAGIRFTLKDK